MSGTLNVTHVVLSLDCGGLERIVLDLAHKGPELGQRVSVICLERPGTLAPQVEEAGARVLCLNKPPGRRPETVDRVGGALRQLRPDVVHTHQIGALFYTGPAARAEAVPLVVHTEHTNQISKYRDYRQQAKIRLLWWVAGRHASRFFCVSEDIASEVRAYGVLPRRKVCVVLNGIDTAQFRRRDAAEAVRGALGIPPGAPVIGTIGRLNEVKCQDLLIRSFHRVQAQVPDARLLLVGDGPKRADLHALAEELGLSGSVYFAGYQAQPERYLQVMDVFALTSRAEGLPLAILEAWAAGLPVVATRVGGIPQVIDDGRTGLLLEPGDENTLTGTLGRLIADPGYARQLGEAGRRQVEARFDTRRMAGDYQRHYLELLATRRVGVGVS
ncbi:MAG: glycosyltransferase [Acidimicrobiia bacterium]|nr:glycosyltransferase [Acidimicrobiia bacterium]